MTAIAWAIITAALIYMDANYTVLWQRMDYEHCKFVGGTIFFCMFVTVICTFVEWFKK